jgi:hypothetical protein
MYLHGVLVFNNLDLNLTLVCYRYQDYEKLKAIGG